VDAQGEALALAKALIACRSLTPDDDGCLDRLAARLAAAGFTCERIDRGGVKNLWARHGTAAPLVCLAGHVDVVPPGPVERWQSDPFAPSERDGYLYGRGAADMKTSVAAMVVAAERVAGAAPAHRGSVALLFTSDEEGDGVDGTRAVVQALAARGETIDACLVGEPVSRTRFGDTVKVGRRGSLTGTLRVEGVQCHIAYPERGRNPIHAALPALSELAAARWDEGTDRFPPTGFQISNIHAGTGATNVIPGALEVCFNLRFSPALTVDAIEGRIREVLGRHGLEYELTWAPVAEPFATGQGPLVATLSRHVQDVLGVTPEPSTSGGTSDGRFLAPVSREIVEFGPLAEGMHGIDERVRVADIGLLTTIYERTVTSLLTG